MEVFVIYLIVILALVTVMIWGYNYLQNEIISRKKAEALSRSLRKKFEMHEKENKIVVDKMQRQIADSNDRIKLLEKEKENLHERENQLTKVANGYENQIITLNDELYDYRKKNSG